MGHSFRTFGVAWNDVPQVTHVACVDLGAFVVACTFFVSKIRKNELHKRRDGSPGKKVSAKHERKFICDLSVGGCGGGGDESSAGEDERFEYAVDGKGCLLGLWFGGEAVERERGRCWVWRLPQLWTERTIATQTFDEHEEKI